MKRRSPLLLGLLGLASILAGCDYTSKKPPALPEVIVSGPLPTTGGRAPAPNEVAVASDSEAPAPDVDLEIQRRREVILANFIKLIQTASTNPGGQNFAIATENLNDLFSQGTKPNDYVLIPKSRDFLLRKIFELSRQDPEPVVKAFCSEKFTIRDARHIEDCMLYHLVATRVAGEGDDLTKVRRIFDWLTRNVLLVPPDSLSGNGLRQAQVRPADALYRGMATEAGAWSERGWVFMALCRQVGVDVGILTFSPSQSIMAGGAAQGPKPVIPWICAAVVDKKAYLFDQRIGIEIPGPDGTGVATLEEAITDPIVLGRLELPGQLSYGTTAADLAGSSSKIGVLIDSSQGYLAPRMRLLQGQLRGEYRTNLYRDPAEEAANLADAIGRQRIGNIRFWDLPIRVEESLFSKPEFVAATQLSLQFFDGKLPLLFARTAQLRGELDVATDKYVALRFAENAVMNNAKKDPIPREVQRALDFYSSYFLAQAHLDRGNQDQAEFLLRKFLEMAPEPGPGKYYYYMLRWGALTNLARICEAKGDRAGAIALYAQNIQTAQQHGNLLRARNLAWDKPFDEPVAPLSPAPPPTPDEMKAAAR